MHPRVIDNDRDEISVMLGDRELRGWSYRDETERRAKIGRAREYIEGWCDCLREEVAQMKAALHIDDVRSAIARAEDSHV
jgi:hypothetical protein